jgi:hypothetical protein
MMPVPDDLKSLLDPTYDDSDYDGPLYWLWVFNPIDGKVTVATNDDKHPADTIGHEHIVPDATHPSRQEGYCYKIRGGYRITDITHKPIKDPYVKREVRKECEHDLKRFAHQ